MRVTIKELTVTTKRESSSRGLELIAATVTVAFLGVFLNDYYRAIYARSIHMFDCQQISNLHIHVSVINTLFALLPINAGQES